MAFNILCLDGGGIRGVITARILKEIEAQIQTPLHEYFDMIAGTSTGSILAAGLSIGMTADELIKVYEDDGETIFPYTSYYSLARIPHVIKYKSSLIKGAFQAIRDNMFDNKQAPSSSKNVTKQLLGLFEASPKFSNEGLIKVLKQHLGERKICEINKTKLLILAYDTFYRNTTFFTSCRPQRRWYDDVFLWEICTSSASAPTFFPPYEFRWKDSEGNDWSFPHVDGGVSANNPSLAALVEAMTIHKQKLEDISILSIGTGRTTEPYNYDEVKSWGFLDWAKQIPGILMGSQLQINSALCFQILKSNNPNSYLRVNLDLNERLGERLTPNSPRQLLPKNQQVNKFTKQKVVEAMDNGTKDHVRTLIETTEQFINSTENYTDVNGKPATVKAALENFLLANQKAKVKTQ